MRTDHIIFLLVLGFILALISLVPSSEAHLVGGLTRDDQGFKFQFITDPSLPIAGEEIFLAFSIQNATNGFGVLNEEVLVRISNSAGLIDEFEEVEAPFGDFAIPYRIESQGRYTIQIQLDNAEGDPSAEFPLEIVASSGLEFFTIIIIVSLGAIFLAVVVVRLRSGRAHHNH